jgi:hypothetical protein
MTDIKPGSVIYFVFVFNLSFNKVRKAYRKTIVRLPWKTNFMVPTYDETNAFKQIRVPNFGRRYVWAADRTSHLHQSDVIHHRTKSRLVASGFPMSS